MHRIHCFNVIRSSCNPVNFFWVFISGLVEAFTRMRSCFFVRFLATFSCLCTFPSVSLWKLTHAKGEIDCDPKWGTVT